MNTLKEFQQMERDAKEVAPIIARKHPSLLPWMLLCEMFEAEELAPIPRTVILEENNENK